MARPLPLTALGVCLLAIAMVRAGEPAEEAKPDVARLIAQLGDDSPKARDQALEALVALGDAAAPALKTALKHDDAEIRWRAELALHRIQWRVGPELAARIGDLMDGFEERPVAEREMICRDLVLAGRAHAVPTLKQVLTADPSNAVRQAAARALVLLGDDGLKALLDAGVHLKGLERYTVSVRIHIGNSYLEQGEYDKALAEYGKAKALEPRNSIVHYNIACTYSRMKKLPEALDALEFSVECGYRDVEWMEKDPDLDNLREQPRYKALVEKLRLMDAREE